MSEVEKIRKKIKRGIEITRQVRRIQRKRDASLEESFVFNEPWIRLQDVLPLAERLDKVVKDQKETDRLLKLEAKMIADDMDRMEKLIEIQGQKLDKIKELLKNRHRYHVYDSDAKQTISFAYRGLLEFIEVLERELK